MTRKQNQLAKRGSRTRLRGRKKKRSAASRRIAGAGSRYRFPARPRSSLTTESRPASHCGSACAFFPWPPPPALLLRAPLHPRKRLRVCEKRRMRSSRWNPRKNFWAASARTILSLNKWKMRKSSACFPREYDEHYGKTHGGSTNRRAQSQRFSCRAAEGFRNGALRAREREQPFFAPQPVCRKSFAGRGHGDASHRPLNGRGGCDAGKAF